MCNCCWPWQLVWSFPFLADTFQHCTSKTCGNTIVFIHILVVATGDVIAQAELHHMGYIQWWKVKTMDVASVTSPVGFLDYNCEAFSFAILFFWNRTWRFLDDRMQLGRIFNWLKRVTWRSFTGGLTWTSGCCCHSSACMAVHRKSANVPLSYQLMLASFHKPRNKTFLGNQNVPINFDEGKTSW